MMMSDLKPQLCADAPMPSAVEKMSKQELWNWFPRSQRAAAEKKDLAEKFFTVTTGLHSARLSGNPYEIIEKQRKRISGLEIQMAQMQKGYDKKLKRVLKAQPAPTDPVAYQKRYALQSGGMGAWQPTSKAAYDSRAENPQIGFRALYADQPAPTEAQGDEPKRPPVTPAEMIAFIGSHFEQMEDAPDPANVRYTLTVHDLLSAFDWWEPFDLPVIHDEILSAAAAVVARWDSPKWKDEPHTAVFIDRLRKALQPSGNTGELVQGEGRKPNPARKIDTSTVHDDEIACTSCQLTMGQARKLAVQGEDSARLADGYISGTVISDPHATWVALRYESMEKAEVASDLIFGIIDKENGFSCAAPQPQEQS